MHKLTPIPAFILATNESDVFPCRSLLDLNGSTVLEFITKRLKKAKGVGEIFICTSIKSCDDSVVELSEKLKLKVVRGSYDDVIGRLIQAYDKADTENGFIIRGDAPLIDPQFCDELLKLHNSKTSEFTYSEHLFGLPYGTGCEIVGKKVLTAMKEFNVSNYSEKTTLLLRLHEESFKTNKFKFDKPAPDLRLIIGNESDYEFIKELLSICDKNGSSGVYEILNVIEKHPFLLKINKPSEVKEIGLDKLLLFPGKIDSIVNSEFDTTYPISVELTLTNKCNLNCEWCSDRQLRIDRPGSLDFRVYKKFVSDLAKNGTKGLVIEGGGEPSLYPHFKEAVEYALECGLAVGIITNGVKFDYEELVPRLEWIRVSLDADTRATYKKWKGRDYFYTVMDNIKKMCAVKGKCTIGIGYVVTKHNVKYLEEITILLSDFGVNYFYLRPVIDNPDMIIKENLYYLKKYETDKFSVMIHAMEENVIKGNMGIPCRTHSLSCVVAGDGSVFLCGRLNIHDWVEPIGNINEKSFHDIWNGSKRMEQSNTVKDAEFCVKWCPECRMTKFNNVFNRTGKIKTRNFI